MQILPINYNQNTIKRKTMPSFRSVSRIYYNPSVNNIWNESTINTLSMMFRDDLDWINLAKLIHTNFQAKDKVNSYCLACSDGSEAYTYAISLMETAKNNDISKFSTIIGVDKDAEIINAAQSGRINLNPADIDRIDELTCGCAHYFVEPNTPLLIKNNIFSIEDSHSFKPSDILKSKIGFIQDDILEILKAINDRGNSVILCRNVAPYLSREYQQDIVKTLEKVLEKGSLFVIGKIDNIPVAKGYIGKLMNHSKLFKQIAKHVYQRV